MLGRQETVEEEEEEGRKEGKVQWLEELHWDMDEKMQACGVDYFSSCLAGQMFLVWRAREREKDI